MEEVIRINDLSKSINHKVVLSKINLAINRGECVALIGLNGAGKTTLLRCITDELPIDEGTIHILNQKNNSKFLTRKVGILFQENTIQKKMLVKELIQFEQGVYQNALNDKEIDKILSLVHIERNKMTDALSGGQRRFLSFLLVLIGCPEILILDEPTTGMDVKVRRIFWSLICQLKSKGKTIIYSSHYLEEVEEMADKIIILNNGKVLRSCRPLEFITESKIKSILFPSDYFKLFIDDKKWMAKIANPNQVIIKTKNVTKVWEILEKHGCRLEEIEITNPKILDQLIYVENEEKNENVNPVI